MMCCYIKYTDSIVFIPYTIKLESFTYHYKLVIFKVPAYYCALKVWCTVTHLAHVVCLYLPHTSCTVISYYYII